MHGRYVGHVARHDRLHDFLRTILSEHLGIPTPDPTFRAFRLAGSNEVYGYEERSSRTRVICKFYGPRFGWDRDQAASVAAREFHNLETLRSFDLVGSPHHVIRPLGCERDINGVLALEYHPGEQLTRAIGCAVRHHDDIPLTRRLTSLAYFLATLHIRTANGVGVDFDADGRYLDALVARLARQGRVGPWDVDELSWLRDLWRQRPRMWEDQQAWLHGDATPANFLFGSDLDVAAIDLERMKRGDRLFDVGRVAGELQHAWLSATGDWRGAEPFIGHFLWEYSCHFPDRGDAFASITARTPFYMGLNLLRIARNGYVSNSYASVLVDQAKRLLRAC
jgi:aminoglycoside phosphotransferase (APT) family kinase protein